MPSDPKKVAKKAAGGGIDGLIACIVAPMVIAWVKTIVPDMITPEVENAIATFIGVMVAMIFVGVKRGVGNWIKHRR